jgi:hypothetical protein
LPPLASPLGEPGLPRPRTRSAAAIDRIIDWLAVDRSRRYRAGRGATFCNIYACDVAYVAGAYLPRVWWSRDAIRALREGRRVTPRYGATIVELNANSLHDWLVEHGPGFGWKKAASLGELQSAANRGAVAVICGRRRNPARSGHIAVVAPEGGLRARRDPAGRVTMPVLSQAGASNYRRRVPPRLWWTPAQFSHVALYYHG